MGFLEQLRSKYELYRLEQRYTKREKRTTFISGAQYVDGEYVYNTSASTSSSPTSSTKSGQSGAGASAGSGGLGKRLPSVRVAEVFTSGGGKRASRAW